MPLSANSTAAQTISAKLCTPRFLKLQSRKYSCEAIECLLHVALRVRRRYVHAPVRDQEDAFLHRAVKKSLQPLGIVFQHVPVIEDVLARGEVQIECGAESGHLKRNSMPACQLPQPGADGLAPAVGLLNRGAIVACQLC